MSPGRRLSDNKILWTSFVATILITVAFPVIGSMWGITFIDPISDPSAVRQAISSMSPDQHLAHAWITGTLDVAYPLAYCSLFIGSAYKFYDRFQWLVALPFYVLAPTDLLEGVVQILALTNTADWIDAKTFLTPLKTNLFLLGILTTAVGCIVWLIARARTDLH